VTSATKHTPISAVQRAKAVLTGTRSVVAGMFACCVRPSADKTLKTDAPSGVVAKRDKMSGAHDSEYDRLVWEQFHNQSRIGKDRRRFLIVAVFDFCLVTLLWILYTVRVSALVHRICNVIMILGFQRWRLGNCI
jgi:hypothetical protein